MIHAYLQATVGEAVEVWRREEVEGMLWRHVCITAVDVTKQRLTGLI